MMQGKGEASRHWESGHGMSELSGTSELEKSRDVTTEDVKPKDTAKAKRYYIKQKSRLERGPTSLQRKTNDRRCRQPKVNMRSRNRLPSRTA